MWHNPGCSQNPWEGGTKRKRGGKQQATGRWITQAHNCKYKTEGGDKIVQGLEDKIVFLWYISPT